MAYLGIRITDLWLNTNNKCFRLGIGMMVGFAVFDVLINFIAYAIKGEMGIIMAIVLMIILSLILKKKTPITELVPRRWSKAIVLTLVYLAGIFWYASSVDMASSAPKYWSIALSFSRGNFPTKIPWQPNMLTVYHHAPYVIMGSLHALSGLNISIVHRFVSVYVIWATFFVLLGMAREYRSGLVSLVPPLFAILLVGGPVVRFSPIVSFTPLLDYVDFISWLGAGVTNLNGLVYANYHIFGMGGMLVTVVLCIKNWTSFSIKTWAPIIGMSIFTLASEEVIFIPLIFIILVYFCRSYFLNKKDVSLGRGVKVCVVLASVFTVLFCAVQNTIRDSLITRSPDQPRYQLVTKQDVLKRIDWLFPEPQAGWVIPSLGLLLGVVLMLGFATKSDEINILAYSSLIFGFFAIVLNQPGFPTNATRMINYAYAMLFLALGFIIVKIKWFGPLLLTVIIPQLLVGHVKAWDSLVNAGNLNYYVYNFGFSQEPLEWLHRNLPFDKRIVLVDEYPKERSSLIGPALEEYGLFIPTGDPRVKMDLPEIGMDWIDVVTTLNPSAINSLGAQIIFIKTGSGERFSNHRREQLKDGSLFKPIHIDKTGVVYEITDKFRRLNDNEMSIRSSLDLVKSDSRVYLGRFKVLEIRKAALLNLGNRTRLYGPMYKISEDYYIVTEAPMPKIAQKSDGPIDFVFADPNNFPSELNISDFVQVSKSEYFSLWKSRTSGQQNAR